mmetsp:Transcript_4951/g.7338  ORF Transcript_4951/g.7338 Transcript_4951/m.7338 type:complete len:301 (+) Transcript_4951:45-947(+)
MGNEQSIEYHDKENDINELDLESNLIVEEIEGYDSDEAFFENLGVGEGSTTCGHKQRNEENDPDIILPEQIETEKKKDETENKNTSLEKIDADEQQEETLTNGEKNEVILLQTSFNTIDPLMIEQVYIMCNKDMDRTKKLISSIAKDFKQQKSIWARIPAYIKTKLLIPKVSITNHTHHSITCTTYGPFDNLIPIKLINHMVSMIETGSLRYKKIPGLGSGVLQERHGPHIIVTFAAFPADIKDNSLFFVGIRHAHGCGAQEFHYPDDFKLFRVNFRTLLLVPGIGNTVHQLLSFLVTSK